MQKLGYAEKVESNHEYIWHKAGSYIELHKRLIPTYNKDYYSYFGDGWRLAKLKDGTRFSMTDEDQMVYLFTHYAKHYRDAGIGIRHIVDLWVYRNNKPNLNEEYIKCYGDEESARDALREQLRMHKLAMAGGRLRRETDRA